MPLRCALPPSQRETERRQTDGQTEGKEKCVAWIRTVNRNRKSNLPCEREDAQKSEAEVHRWQRNDIAEGLSNLYMTDTSGRPGGCDRVSVTQSTLFPAPPQCNMPKSIEPSSNFLSSCNACIQAMLRPIWAPNYFILMNYSLVP